LAWKELLGSEPRIAVSWRSLPGQVQTLRDPKVPLPSGVVLARTFRARPPGAVGKIALLLLVIFTSPLLVRDPVWLGGVVLIAWFAIAAWWIWARRQAKRAGLDGWRHGWFFTDEGLLIAEGRKASWIPGPAVRWVKETTSGGSSPGWVTVTDADGSAMDKVWSEGSKSQPVGMEVRVQRGSSRAESVHSRRVTSGGEQQKLRTWGMSRGLMEAEVRRKVDGGSFEGEVPEQPLVGAQTGDLPASLASWVDPGEPLPGGVHLMPFGVPARPARGDWFIAFPGSLLPLGLGALALWGALREDEDLVGRLALIGVGLMFLGAGGDLVRRTVLGHLRTRAVEGGRWRQGVFLCDKGVLLRWRGAATWLPLHCLRFFTESRSANELDDMRKGPTSNTEDRWLALLWQTDTESGTAIYPRRLPLADFEQLRGWFRDRGVKRTPKL